MSRSNTVFDRINADMNKVREFEEKKEFDSAISIIKNQISFIEGYLVGEKDQGMIDMLYSLLRDRHNLLRIFNSTKQLNLLEKSTDDRLSNLVHKISKIEKDLDMKKDGK